MNGEQRRAERQAEEEWERFGGPLVDQVEDGQSLPAQAAFLLAERYGLSLLFWLGYLLRIVTDREARTLVVACPNCGGADLVDVGDAARPVTRAGEAHRPGLDPQATGRVGCPRCGFSGPLDLFRMVGRPGA